MYSIIIPTIKKRADLDIQIKNVKEATVGKYELIITSDIEPNQPISAAKNRNLGLNKAKYDIVIMIDDDIFNLPKGWNIKLAEPLLERDDVVMTSARLLNRDGTPGMMTEFSADMDTPLIEMSYLPSACIAFKKDGVMFDESFIGSGYEDSVTGQTELLIRQDGEVKMFHIQDLCPKDEDGRFPVKDMEVWDGRQWTNVHYVYRHTVKKDIYEVRIISGRIFTTGDHSLIQNGEPIKTSDLKVGDIIDVSTEFDALAGEILNISKSPFFTDENGFTTVYDLSTDSGMFADSTSGIIAHNTDFCMQLKEKYPGKRFMLNNAVCVVHANECKNQVGDNWIKNQNYFAKKWKGLNKGISQIPEYDLKKKTISLCMIVKNEERFIEQCLQSADKYVDEIIIVDTGSTDDTKKIAKQFAKVKIYDYLWRDDFAAARNQAITHATKDWILFLDADEELTEFDGADIQAKMNLPVDIPIIYSASFSNPLGTGTVSHFMARFLPNNPNIRYTGRIHEHIYHKEDKKIMIVPTRSIGVLHHGYSQDMVVGRDKAERNIKLLELELQDNPKSSFYLYHLGITYKVAGSNEKAAEIFARWVKTVEEDPSSAQADQSIGYSGYAGALLSLKKYDDILSLARKYDDKSGHNPDWNFNLAQALDQTGKSSDALVVLSRNEKMRNTPPMVASYDVDTVGWKMYALLGNIQSKLAKHQDAFQSWKNSYHLHPNNLDTIKALFVAAVRANDLNLAETLIQQFFNLHDPKTPIDGNLALAHANLYLIKGKLEEAVTILVTLPDYKTHIERVMHRVLQKCKYNDLVRINNKLNELGKAL